MTVMWTFCSGIGAPEVSAPWADHVLACEIEDFPRAVLMHRLGFEERAGAPARLFPDMAAFDAAAAIAEGAPLPDIIVAGTPCQSFSVAGLRQGLKDERGNLTLRFVEILHDATELAGRAGRRPPVAVWENVPGVLSDGDNAFGCFLGAVVGADAALHTPDGGSWPCAGMVAGPRARVAWRVLDAQYFGVAQRRRRVFAVIDLGNGSGIDPAAVLLEPHSLQGHSPPRRETGEGSAGGAGAGAGCGGGGIIAAHETGQGWWNQAPIAGTLRAEGENRPSRPSNVIASTGPALGQGIAKPLGAHALSRGRGTDLDNTTYVGFDLAQITSAANRTRAEPGLPASTISAQSSMHVAVAFAQNSRSEVRQIGGDGSVVGALAADAGAQQQSYVALPTMVRRLTPVECEKLQGFQPGFTDIPWRGKRAPDGQRYKALGNSMAVPCIGWILDRIRAFEAARNRP